MVRNQEVLVKGVQIHKRINELSEALTAENVLQERVVLSHDLYFTLLEYTVLMNEAQVNRDLLLWELFNRDELFFDTGTRQLRVNIDFFLPPNTVNVF